MATERLRILYEAIWKGGQASARAAKDVEKVGKSATKTARGLKDFAAAGAIVAASLTGAIIAGKQLFEALKEGAALELTESRFTNLAESINTTADALMVGLREATSGMVSDAELMGTASEIISVGLANTEDGVVRLARVIAELGLDMQTVILTMANDSKLRLDSLGLSITDVETRAKKFTAAGIAAGEAFDLAVLEALEARLELVGSASDTAAGDIARLETAFANLKTAAAGVLVDIFFADEATRTVDAALERNQKLIEQIQALGEQGRIITEDAAGVAFGGGVALQHASEDIETALNIINRAFDVYDPATAAQNTEALAEAVKLLTSGFEGNATAAARAAVNIVEWRKRLTTDEIVASALAARDAITEQIEATGALDDAIVEGGDISAQVFAAKARAENEANQRMEEATARAKEYTRAAQEMREAQQRAFSGDFIANIGKAADETVNWKDELFQLSVEMGLSNEEMVLLARATGEYSEEQIVAALKTAAMAEKVRELAGLIAAGMSIPDALALLDEFQGALDEPYDLEITDNADAVAERVAGLKRGAEDAAGQYDITFNLSSTGSFPNPNQGIGGGGPPPPPPEGAQAPFAGPGVPGSNGSSVTFAGGATTTNNTTVIYTTTREATALAMAAVDVQRRSRFNAYMRAGQWR